MAELDLPKDNPPLEDSAAANGFVSQNAARDFMPWTYEYRSSMLRETYDGPSGNDRLSSYASFFQFCRLAAVALASLRRGRSASAWVRLVAFDRVSGVGRMRSDEHLFGECHDRHNELIQHDPPNRGFASSFAFFHSV
jgi:hypothetical protein